MWHFRKVVLSDEELVEAFSNGEKRAYEALYRRFAPMLLNFVSGMTKDTGAAEDIVQNIFMKMMLTSPSFISVGAFKNWLYVCARNEVLSFLNSKWEKHVEKMAELSDNVAAIPVEHKSEQASEQETISARTSLINSTLEEMPQRRAEVFKMSKIEKIPTVEIARRMGISERTVQKHLQLAYQDIRKRSS